jgi:hypothetical protein
MARVKSLTWPPFLPSRPTNPNPNRYPRSRDSKSPAVLPHDPGELRCRLPKPRGAIGPPPWPLPSHRGKSSSLTSPTYCTTTAAPGRPTVSSGAAAHHRDSACYSSSRAPTSTSRHSPLRCASHKTLVVARAHRRGCGGRRSRLSHLPVYASRL